MISLVVLFAGVIGLLAPTSQTASLPSPSPLTQALEEKFTVTPGAILTSPPRPTSTEISAGTQVGKYPCGSIDLSTANLIDVFEVMKKNCRNHM